MIYYIRHGQTDFNLDVRVQGQLDIPLNEKGLQEAQMARENMADVHIDLIFSSPLKRAKVTAEVIRGNRNIPIVFDDRLKEICAGSLQGKLFMELTQYERDHYFERPEDFGGEGREQVKARVLSFYEEIKDSTKDILIVSHSVIGKILFEEIGANQNYTDAVPVIANCQIVVLKDDKKETQIV